MSTISPSQADPRDFPRRRRGKRLLLGLILALLALAAAAAALHSVDSRQDSTTFRAAQAHELVIDLHAGRIELASSPDDIPQVTTTRHWSVWAPSTHQDLTGGVLTVTGGCPPLGTLGITRCAVDERVTVPAGMRVRVTTSTGDLIGTDLAVSSFDAHTTRGSVTASFTRPPTRILTQLDAGNVRLTVHATTYAVDATTPPRAGRVTVAVPTDPGSPYHISAHISRGDIQILRR
jgi:hypothetical protein